MDFSRFAVLDEHNWYAINGSLSTGTGYWENIHALADNDLKFCEINTKLKENWAKNMEVLVPSFSVPSRRCGGTFAANGGVRR